MSSVDTDIGRYYPFKGKRYTSVTTILGQTVPKPGLNNWKIRRMAEVAAENRLALAEKTEIEAKDWLLLNGLAYDGSAAVLGSSIHAMVDNLSRGLDIRVPSEVESKYLKSYFDFIDTHQPEFLETEAVVYNRTHGYAGRLDFIAAMGGIVVVGDYKTGKSVWPESALQVAAYANAEFIGRTDGTEDPLPETSGGVIVHLRPRSFKVYRVSTGPEVFDTFLSALDMFRWLHVDSKEVIGKRL